MDLEDLPADLRSLGRRIPENVRANLTALEARVRCEEAAELLDQANETSDEVKAGRLRGKARRLLKAVSPAAYQTAMTLLEAELREARLQHADREASGIQAEMVEFDRANPQVDPGRVLAAAKAAVSQSRKLPPIPPMPGGHAFGRRNRRARKARLTHVKNYRASTPQGRHEPW